MYKRFVKPSLTQRLWIVYTLILIYLYLIQSYVAWPFTIDDAYISLRYAKHLYHHHGLVWNKGELPIEGYSNFTYVLLATIAFYLNVSAIFLLKIFSFLSMGASLIGLYCLTRLWLPSQYAILPGLLLLIHPGQILWGVSGLETPFYQFLIIMSTYSLIKALKHKNNHFVIVSGVILALASLTRPEAPMFFLCFLMIVGFTLNSFKNQYVLFFTLSFSLFYVPFCLWRLIYFGDLFPHPVHCKVMNAPSQPWALDASYLALIFPLLCVVVIGLRKKWEPHFLFLVLPSLCYLITLYNADGIVGFHDRHFLTAYALLLPLFVLSIYYLINPIVLSSSIKPYSIMGLTLLFGYLFNTAHYSLTDFNHDAMRTQAYNQLRTELAQWIGTQYPVSNHIALSDCGIVPFTYGGPVIDNYCINNKIFSSPTIHYDYDRYADWLLQQRQPHIIILSDYFEPQINHFLPPDHAILMHHDFRKSYHPIKQFSVSLEGAGLEYIIYERVGDH